MKNQDNQDNFFSKLNQIDFETLDKIIDPVMKIAKNSKKSLLGRVLGLFYPVFNEDNVKGKLLQSVFSFKSIFNLAKNFITNYKKTKNLFSELYKIEKQFSEEYYDDNQKLQSSKFILDLVNNRSCLTGGLKSFISKNIDNINEISGNNSKIGNNILESFKNIFNSSYQASSIVNLANEFKSAFLTNCQSRDNLLEGLDLLGKSLGVSLFRESAKALKGVYKEFDSFVCKKYEAQSVDKINEKDKSLLNSDFYLFILKTEHLKNLYPKIKDYMPKEYQELTGLIEIILGSSQDIMKELDNKIIGNFLDVLIPKIAKECNNIAQNEQKILDEKLTLLDGIKQEKSIYDNAIKILYGLERISEKDPRAIELRERIRKIGVSENA